MMLVDLTRNDLGSICVPGSIKVTKLLAVEKFSAVMHLSSTIQGTLQENLDALDAIKACFPALNLSGAPKIRAMGIIDELEDTSRGIYGGANVQSMVMVISKFIAIRTAMIRDGKAVVRAGAGIVYDSDPQQEADEKLITKHVNFSGNSISRGDQIMILIIDNYDSFTYNLYQYVAELTSSVSVVRNHKISIAEIEALKPTGIILSPGPGRPENAGICIELIVKLSNSFPFLVYV